MVTQRLWPQRAQILRLLLLNFGAQCADTLRQAVSFGMHKNMTILVAWASGLEQFESLGADLATVFYFGAGTGTRWIGSNRDLVKRTNDKLKMNPQLQPGGLVYLHKAADRRNHQGRVR